MTTIESLHETFVRELPELEVMAKAHFRHLDPDAREEAAQNVRALSWKYWLRLCQQGRGHEEGLLRNVWWFAIKQTKVGRTITRGDGKRGKARHDAYDQSMVEHIDFNLFIGADTPIPDAVAFRIDFPMFLATLNERQRVMAADLASGMTTTEAAREHGVTPGAVSQFRVRFKVLLERFHAGAA
jgi:hypothetical protein